MASLSRNAEPFNYLLILKLVIAFLGAVAVVLYGFLHPVVLHPDFHHYIYLAERIEAGRPESWLGDPLHYPLGYPMILRFMSNWVGDYWTAGKLLTAAFSLLFLASAYLLFRRWSTTLGGALLAFALLLAVPALRFWLHTPSTDLPFAALALAGLLALETTERRRRYLWAGLLLGAAYDFRFSALAFLPAGPLLALWEARFRCIRQVAGNGALYLGGFLLASLPQTLPSLVVHGNPFFNQQSQNFDFYVFGAGAWPRFPDFLVADSSFMAVFLKDPGACLRHWSENARQFLSGAGALPLPAVGLLYLGAVAAWWGRPQAAPRWPAWTLCALPYTLGTLLFAPTPRYFLWLAPPAVYCGLLALATGAEALRLPTRLRAGFGVGLALGFGLFWHPPEGPAFAELARQVREVSTWLAQQPGYQAHAVGATSAFFHDTQARDLSTYRVGLDDRITPRTEADELAGLLSDAGCRFFVYDSLAGPRFYPGLASLLDEEFAVRGLARRYRSVGVVSTVVVELAEPEKSKSQP